MGAPVVLYNDTIQCKTTTDELVSNMWYAFNFHLLSTFSGATKSIYAPEPFDVGRILQADILTDEQTITVTTSAPIDPGLLVINFVFL